MGKMLCICSEEKGSGKTTLACVLTMNFLQNIPNKKILVLCANMNKGNLMSLMGVEHECIELGQVVNFKQNWGSAQIASKRSSFYENCCFVHTKFTGKTFLEKNIETYFDVLDDIIKQFDIIIADIPANRKNVFANKIKEQSQIIVKVNLSNIEENELNASEKNLLMEVKSEKFGHVEVFVNNSFSEVGKEYVGMLEKVFVEENYVMEKKEFTDFFKIELPYCNRLKAAKNKTKLNKYHFYNTNYNKSVLEIAQRLDHELDIPKGVWESFGVKTSNSKTNTDRSKKQIIDSFFRAKKYSVGK